MQLNFGFEQSFDFDVSWHLRAISRRYEFLHLNHTTLTRRVLVGNGQLWRGRAARRVDGQR
jgi:hypothetical protein